MISDELEKTLQRTQKYAKSFKHQYMTLEHLLFSMLDDSDVIKVLDACVIDKDKLKKNLEKFVEGNLKDLVNESSENEVKPTLGFQRVIQRAVIHVQSSGKEEANAANGFWRNKANSQVHTARVAWQSKICLAEADRATLFASNKLHKQGLYPLSFKVKPSSLPTIDALLPVA